MENLTAGPELDARIAKEVMGWEEMIIPNGLTKVWDGETLDAPLPVSEWQPSTNFHHARAVVDFLLHTFCTEWHLEREMKEQQRSAPYLGDDARCNWTELEPTGKRKIKFTLKDGRMFDSGYREWEPEIAVCASALHAAQEVKQCEPVTSN